MIRTIWAMTRGYRLCPWRSPYLRWRGGTYRGLHADPIGFAPFWRFARRGRRGLIPDLRGGERMREPLLWAKSAVSCRLGPWSGLSARCLGPWLYVALEVRQNKGVDVPGKLRAWWSAMREWRAGKCIEIR